MKEIDVDEMKKIQFDILSDVAKFCDENHIKYFLYYGTLLGAVRHKGFIPWDDDIDIAMPRPDYEKFLSTYSSKDYDLFHWTKDSKNICLYTKVYNKNTVIIENSDWGTDLGVNIDIFPLDGLPNEKKKIDSFIKKMQRFYGFMVCALIKDPSGWSFSHRMAIKFMHVIYKIIPIKHFINGKAIKSVQKYPFHSAEKVSNCFGGLAAKEIIDRNVYDECTKLEFESGAFNVPLEYEKCLTVLYGDYMRLPPENERVYKHGVKAFWKNSI